jgi:hypothetical protein
MRPVVLAGDVDCVDVNAPINMTGADPNGLDNDGDSTGCQ